MNSLFGNKKKIEIKIKLQHKKNSFFVLFPKPLGRGRHSERISVFPVTNAAACGGCLAHFSPSSALAK